MFIRNWEEPFLVLPMLVIADILSELKYMTCLISCDALLGFVAIGWPVYEQKPFIVLFTFLKPMFFLIFKVVLNVYPV